MKKYTNKFFVSVILGAFFLSFGGCVTSPKIPTDTTSTIVISPPETLFNCPQVDSLPNPATLTNQQVANLIVSLVKDNQICGENMGKIQSYISKAKAIVEKRKG